MSTPHDAYAVLRLPEFRWFIFAKFLFILAVQMQSTIVGWQIYEITKDPLSLGLIGLAEILPFFAVALHAGHVADVVPRRRIIILATSAFFIGVISLLFFTLDDGAVLKRHGVWPIYAVIALTGLARAFDGPAMNAFVTQIVPRELYPNSAAWGSTTWQTAAVMGPALGGAIYGWAGVTAAYATAAGLAALAIVGMTLVKPRPLPVREMEESVAESLKAGIRFVFKTPIILGSISLDMFAVLFGGAVALLPIFAAEVLHVGPEGLGALRAAPFIGAAITAIFLAHRPPKRRAGIILLQCVAGFGFCIIAFALSVNLYLSLFILALSGALDCVSVIIRATILQLYTPDAMRGRVSAVDSIFIGSSNELGAFESGVAAKLLGLVRSVVFGGTMTLIVVAATAYLAPALRKLHIGAGHDDELKGN